MKKAYKITLSGTDTRQRVSIAYDIDEIRCDFDRFGYKWFDQGNEECIKLLEIGWEHCCPFPNGDKQIKVICIESEI